MKDTTQDTLQARWARFRFSIIGPLLAAPPSTGELQDALKTLAKKEWKHPISGRMVRFNFSTLERWFYQVRKAQDPVHTLRSKRRSDADRSKILRASIKSVIQQQYREHPGWSYQLHRDNLAARIQALPELGPLPSYNTVRRYMKANDLYKRRPIKHPHTLGAQKAAQRLEEREVRSFEMSHVHALWHLDFHQGSLKILNQKGQWERPRLLAIMDDYSRLVCHAQWYLNEDTESLVHGFMQALQKRALPRALMSDNGAAMSSAEFTEGLERLGILHQPTLSYSPYQNGKQETYWAQVEGRLLAMLEGTEELTLSLLNQATLAWMEMEYHRKIHAELSTTPLERYINGQSVGRPCPETKILQQAFVIELKRRQRKSDGTITLEGRRFEIPNCYRHLEDLTVRVARWDLSHALLIDPHQNKILSTLYPQDKCANASGLRRKLSTPEEPIPRVLPKTGIAPLLKTLMAEYAATGLPPAYLHKGEDHE